jgi:enamine deaminase RidA (YjgF/YER057c/UK114 family)
MGRIESRLVELGIELPTELLRPRARSLGWRRSGQIAFLAGQGPIWNGAVAITGRCGADLSLERAQEAARLCALNLLVVLKEACGGDLDKVTACLMVQGYIRCIDSYNDTPLVLNGASDVFIDVFGEAGMHARTAVGVNALPLDIPIEVQAVFEVGN